MLDTIEKLMSSLPPLHAKKNPSLSLIIGFAFGGIGLAIYFRSIIDLAFPIGIALASIRLFGDMGLFAGSLMAGFYGYFRAVQSNKTQAS